MHFHPVIERIPIVPALDPLWAIFFLAAFAAAAYAVNRRPVYGAAILIFVVPFALPHAILGTTVTLGKAVLPGVIAGLASRYDGRKTPGAPLLLTAAFAAIVLIDASTFSVAAHRLEVVRETLKWVEFSAFFMAVFACYSSEPQPRVVRSAWALSLAIVALSALAELFTGAGSDLIVRSHTLPRIAGALEGPNQLGGYLELTIAAFAAWQTREPRRRFAWILALAGFVLALSFSRAALGCTALALAVIAWNERARIVRVWTIAAGVVAAYVVTLFAIPGIGVFALLEAVAWQRASDIDAAMSGGVGTRSELWHAALVLFGRHPVLGVGAGNYQYDLPEAGLYGVRTQANNWYLQSLAEGGVILFAATLAWLLAVFSTLRAHVASSPWALGALAATIAMVVHGFADDLVFYPKVAETWIALIALGCVRSSSR